MANLTQIGPWDEQRASEGAASVEHRFREHAASLRRVARVVASPQDRALLEHVALSYECLADRLERPLHTGGDKIAKSAASWARRGDTPP